MHDSVADRYDLSAIEQSIGDPNDLLGSSAVVQSRGSQSLLSDTLTLRIGHFEMWRNANAFDQTAKQQRFVELVVQTELDARGSGVNDRYAAGHARAQAMMFAPPST
jgi:hypothetical protein